ncbi:syndetin-like isoform X1 [Cynara cardunculus var. scolymus]|uniref:syndetin-like isoform X1 n=2 Tax=Cynara cardunculus var. scolymus TaxID=59895 RepID=UPI000D62F28A|nr:syndetin-like isoform X1 [Cynara cardunculus var. scolymus]
MQPSSFSVPPLALIPLALNHGNLSPEGFEIYRFLFLGSLLLSPGGGSCDNGGGMDLSKVGEKFLSSVRSARSLGFLPSTSDRTEVPARAAAAATIARALASIPPHHRQNISSSSEQLSSIYGSEHRDQVLEELEEEFYEEEFDPVRHALENIPSEENDHAYFERKASLRLLQLDKVTESLSRQVMEHHEVMVKGMDLVGELEKDLKIANVICMNGRRHLTSSRNEVSRDLIVNTSSRRKQTLLEVLLVLKELRRAKHMQIELETHVNEDNFFKAFQVLSEYLQLLDSLSELSAIQEMSRGVEIWLGKALQKLDSLLLGVCQDFKETSFLTVVDAYALIGDVSGLAEKIQSFFMQEVISGTHAVLKSIVLEDLEAAEMQSTRLTYSDLCTRIPESKYRQCLLETLAVLFKLMCSYYTIMSFHSEYKVPMGQVSHEVQKQADETGSSKNVQQAGSLSQYSCSSEVDVGFPSQSFQREPNLASMEEPLTSAIIFSDESGTGSFIPHDPSGSESRDDGGGASSSGSPWFQLRNDATVFVSETLQRGRNYLWQLATSRVSVLLSSAAVSSASIHQFLKIYEDLNIFILAGEAFCGAEAVEFRQKVKAFCENYYIAFHRQNIHALKMVLERESWSMLSPETIQVVSFAGLVGDGAALISQTATSSTRNSHKSADLMKTGPKQGVFFHWIRSGNPFCSRYDSKCDGSPLHGVSAVSEEPNGKINGASHRNNSSHNSDANHSNGHADASEDENEDLLADFIDEDSQLPTRNFKPKHSSNHSLPWSSEDTRAHTGSSICVLRLMDKYARLMQRLEIINVELFKGICQLFGIFFYFIFESFGHQNTNPSGKGNNEALTYRLKTALSRIFQDCSQWITSSSSSDNFFPHAPLNMPFSHMDITPTSPPSANSSHIPGTSFGLKERCAGADTISLVAHLMYKFKAHLQSILLTNNATVLEEFYLHVVDSVPDLTEQIHRTTAKLLFHISGYADRIASAKWEVKELGMEHNGYVDLLLGEFKHYKTRLAHGGIRTEVQDLLIEYGLETISETLIEGLSRVKRCSDEGRALMLLDLQVLINGLQHFVTINVKPKLYAVETFIKAYYLPETEYVHWARAHPEYTKSQMAGLINLVATMKGWKRKTRLEVLEKIESGGL